jgi:iron complex outermembrane receptor protein
VGENGHVGVAGRYFDSLYGIPVALEEEGIRIDLEQTRYDVRGGFDTAFGPFDGIDFSVGLVDYEHSELVEDEIGTRFFQDTVDSRIELSHDGFEGKLRGVAGLQYGRRDLEAIGDEAFLPPSITDVLALFAVEEIQAGRMIYEAGLRVSSQSTSADLRPDRDFTGASGSLGVLAKLGDQYRVGGSISRTERFPRAEELYSDGPHFATLTFERGDPDLDPEISAGLDVSLRKAEGRFSGELTLFVNRYDGYIFEAPQFDAGGQPEIEDGLPVFRFSQRDAEFVGGELDVHVGLWESGAQHVGLQLMGDYVRAEFTDGGTPIPFMPPWRAGTALHYRGARWHASADVWVYAKQDRVPTAQDFGGVAEPEFAGLYGLTPTDGYTMVDAHVGYRVPAGRAMLHEVLLRGTNLTDVDARNAVSRLKDFVPLPGRDVALVYRLVF